MNDIQLIKPFDEVPCLYCEQPCPKTIHDENRELRYYCQHHAPLEVFYRYVKNGNHPWFFNTVRITLNSLRLDYHPSVGEVVRLDKLIPHKEKCWGEHWKTIFTFPFNVLLVFNIKQIYSFLNLYKVWS